MKLLCLLATFCSTIPLFSQSISDVNIDQALQTRLSEVIPADVENNTDSPRWSKDVVTLDWRILPETISIQIGDQFESSDPVRAISQEYQNVNCSDKPRSWIETFSVSVNKFSSVSYSKTVSSTTSENSSVDLKFSLQFGPLTPTFGHSTSKQLLEQISLVNQQSKTHTESQTTQRSIEVSAEPHQQLTVTATQEIYTAKVPFTISFQVDGEITYKHVITASKLTGWTNNTYAISEFLSEQDRTFTISGYISENETSKLKIQFDTLEVTSCKE